MRVKELFLKQDSPETRSFGKGILGKITSPLGAFGLGIATSSLLLPCTSGPYFVAISFISRFPLRGIVLLFMYNLIFILPFLAILIGVDRLSLQTEQVKSWWEKRGKTLELLSGLAILLISLYLVLS